MDDKTLTRFKVCLVNLQAEMKKRRFNPFSGLGRSGKAEYVYHYMKAYMGEKYWRLLPYEFRQAWDYAAHSFSRQRNLVNGWKDALAQTPEETVDHPIEPRELCERLKKIKQAAESQCQWIKDTQERAEELEGIFCVSADPEARQKLAWLSADIQDQNNTFTVVIGELSHLIESYENAIQPVRVNTSDS